MKAPRRITHQQIQDLLATLGFVGAARDDGSKMYRHPEAGTLILLPAQRGDHFAREPDIQSVGRHLVGRGHLEEHAFEAFVREGILPEITPA